MGYLNSTLYLPTQKWDAIKICNDCDLSAPIFQTPDNIKAYKISTKKSKINIFLLAAAGNKIYKHSGV